MEMIEAIDALRADRPAQVVATPDGGSIVVCERNQRVEKIHPLEKMLPRIRQAPTFYDLASFTGYVTAFKTDTTRIFGVPGTIASDGRAKLTAILDYHGPGKPDHGAHVATYAPRYSEQWDKWTKAGSMPQAAFAEFIEENRADISEPDAATLLDIVTKFRTTRKQEFNGVVYQPNGDVVIGWSDTTESAGKGVAVPTELKLGIPVFFRGTLYAVPVLMRYRVPDGKLTFTVKVDRAALIEQTAFDEIAKAASDATGIGVLIGAA